MEKLNLFINLAIALREILAFANNRSEDSKNANSSLKLNI